MEAAGPRNERQSLRLGPRKQSSLRPAANGQNYRLASHFRTREHGRDGSAVGLIAAQFDHIRALLHGGGNLRHRRFDRTYKHRRDNIGHFFAFFFAGVFLTPTRL